VGAVSENGRAVDEIVERIHYLLVTSPQDLVLSAKEQGLLNHLHGQCNGSWNRLAGIVEARMEQDPKNRKAYALTLAHIGWLRAYESRHNVSLADLYAPAATRTS
jgi:hypothetical protein